MCGLVVSAVILQLTRKPRRGGDKRQQRPGDSDLGRGGNAKSEAHNERPSSLPHYIRCQSAGDYCSP